MYLGVHPEGPHLTPSQAKTLDDEFFLADPLGHFASRITMLLNARSSLTPPTSTTHPAFFEALGLEGVSELPQTRNNNQDVQVAVDALALRHQCAEALARFLYALTAKPSGSDAACTWWTVADSPTSMMSVITAVKEAFDADEHLLVHLMFVSESNITEQAVLASSTALEWINHAKHLLVDDELSINAAHNKLKHGLAVAFRDDIRVDLVATTATSSGEVPLSAFEDGKSIPLFDRPMITYLSRPYGKPKPGLELVSLRVDIETVLTETWMMATVYAALFRVAATRHFGGYVPDEVAAYPGLAIGRTPERVIGSQSLGFRSPVTLPADGNAKVRPAGAFFYQTFWPMEIDFASRTRAVIVDG